ncbi:hypothetical protein L596_025560 [Steinernema carpocapsae]|uniref:Uncharacterized protein n=1 Tax=Steinernema carpocapsae TaxID=34508 RepID=A0A4U5M849_STECR|nr:hypothetical protein L596_025560 [Steinernema carpocapsae]
MDRRGKSGSRVCFTCNRANNAYGNMHKTIEDDGRHRCMLDCSSCRGELILSRVKGLPDYGPCHKAVDCPIHKEAQDRASHIAEISRIYRELTGERSEKKTFPPAAMTLYIDRCYEYMEGNHHASAEDVRRYAQKVLFEKAYPGIGIMDDVLQGEHNGYVQHVKELNQAKFFIELKPVMHFELSADAFELVRQDIYPYEVSEVRLYNVVTNRDEVVEFLEENKDCVEQYLYQYVVLNIYSISFCSFIASLIVVSHTRSVTSTSRLCT